MQPTADIIQKGYADTPSGQVHFRKVAGPGTPVILLHRTPVASESFTLMLRLLAGKCTAIAFDTPGFGQSFRPSGQPTTKDYATWFLAAIDAMGIDRFHLSGHHSGTHFSAEIAVLAPARVRSLLLNGVMYATADERVKIRSAIGDALPVDEAGTYLTNTWKLLRGLYTGFHAQIIHGELLGALNSIEGRDQVFSAILSQDFAALLAGIECPISIVQSVDDPWAPMLNRVRAAKLGVPIEVIGAAQTAAPELQAEQYSAALLQFIGRQAAATPRGLTMLDRRFQLDKTDGGFDLKMTRTERPTPGPTQVLMKVHAASLNRRDVMIRELSYPVFDADHFTPLSDAAGEIVAIGSAVTKFAVGDRVCSTFFQHWPDGRLTFPALLSALGAGGPGVLADHVILAESGVAHIPADWSFVEGASISCAALTAWSGLAAGGGVQRDDWVLVIGTGGVALFALQMAVAKGAKVVVLSSSESKRAKARALGATVTIDYLADAEWDATVRKATGGTGVNYAIELGGAGTLSKSVASLAVGGQLSLIGALAGFGGDLSAAALITGALQVNAIVVGSHAQHVAMTRFLAASHIRPVIDSIFEIDALEAAYARASEGAFGKVVVRF